MISVKACRGDHAVTIGELLRRRLVGLLVRELGGHSVRRCRPAVFRIFSTGNSLRTAAGTWSGGRDGRRGSVDGDDSENAQPVYDVVLHGSLTTRGDIESI